MQRRRTRVALLGLALVALGGTTAATSPTPSPTREPAGTIGHVWVVVLENKSYTQSFSPATKAPMLHSLAARGALLQQYFGIAHSSLPNYLALVSGQGPNPATQANCQTYTPFVAGDVRADGQFPGSGCVYPAVVPDLGSQLTAKGVSWKAYLEDLGASRTRQVAPCGTPAVDGKGHDLSQTAGATDQYAARHNPFAYFAAFTADPQQCTQHLAPLTALATDTADAATTPAFNLVVPNLCNDGHDTGCAGDDAAGDRTGNLTAVEHWLARYVPMITGSAAFAQDGLLVVTWDEAASSKGRDGRPDASACCDEEALNSTSPGGAPDDDGTAPELTGPGGGRVGAILLSPRIRPGTVSTHTYNHYSTLRTVEDLFGLPRLGYAGQAGGVDAFGEDVFGSVASPAATAAPKGGGGSSGLLVAGAAAVLVAALLLALRRRAR